MDELVMVRYARQSVHAWSKECDPGHEVRWHRGNHKRQCKMLPTTCACPELSVWGSYGVPV